jgi:glycosyltransferase involved in cell wall biosynthesis
VIGTLQIGGAEVQLCRLAVELSARGHWVHIFAQSGGGPLQQFLEQSGIPYSTYAFHPGARLYTGTLRRIRPIDLTIKAAGAARDLVPMLKVWWDLGRSRADVCHAVLPQAYFWNMIGSRLVGIPIRIAGRRALTFAEPKAASIGAQVHRALGQLSRRWTTITLANSAAVAKSAHEVEAIPIEKIRVIPNGVDLPRLIDTSMASPDRTPPVGLMVANLIEYKGHSDLIQALSGMIDPPTIRLVGDGPERATLEAMARRAGLESKLLFEGSTPQASRLFGEVQFAVLASHQEGMPNAVLEAMAYGLPTVATSVGGIPELIEHEVQGLLVPPHDPLALRSAIVRIAGDARLRARLGRAARLRALDFGWDRCAQGHLDLYAELLARSRRGGKR